MRGAKADNIGVSVDFIGIIVSLMFAVSLSDLFISIYQLLKFVVYDSYTVIFLHFHSYTMDLVLSSSVYKTSQPVSQLVDFVTNLIINYNFPFIIPHWGNS
jgi:hypothetical protein